MEAKSVASFLLLHQVQILPRTLKNKTGNLTFARPCIIIRFKQFNQQDATVSQVYYLTFMCGSTCFGRLLAHHREHTTALGLAGNNLPDHDQQRSSRFSPTAKPEAPSAAVCS